MELTRSIKNSDVSRAWLVVDATDVPLGRLSSEIAARLRGKHRANFTPHVDCGDNVIVINAEKVRLTGRKLVTHTFHWHTGYPGGIRSISSGKELKGSHPERVVERSVQRMLPRSRLGRGMIGKLHVYTGMEHPHTAQKPQAWDVKSALEKRNRKTK